jgi:hypothetical protein
VTPDGRQKPRVPRSFANRGPGVVPIQHASPFPEPDIKYLGDLLP